VIVILVLAFGFFAVLMLPLPLAIQAQAEGSRKSSPISPTYWPKLKKKWDGASRINRTKRRLANLSEDGLSSGNLA
jgi:hypothetical protein